MSLAWNTRKLASAECGDDAQTPTPVEFHFLSRRELYDSSILTADRYSSSAGEWVAWGAYPWYSVSVVTRPVYSLPQELCLSFGCFHRTTTIGNSSESGPPIEEVANEFAALLSLLVREPLVPLGTRRIGGKPIKLDDVGRQVPRPPPANQVPAGGVDSRDLRQILVGLANAAEADSNAVLAACRLYHAGLSLSAYDVSTAYFSLVASIECLAGHHFSTRSYGFDEVEKFKKAAGVLDKIAPSLSDPAVIEELKRELLRVEHFVWQKFRSFIEEFLTDDFWTRDDLHPKGYLMPTIEKQNLRKFLREAYDARSAFAHTGTPFPAHVEAGIADRVRVRAMMEGLALHNTAKFVPVFPWFERLTHFVVMEYLARVIAPGLAIRRAGRLSEKKALLGIVKELPEAARGSLENLTRWTAQFVGYALIGPKAPNRSWASDEESVRILSASGLIGTDDTSMDGSSWLLNREVGEAAGEFFYGVDTNPLKDAAILEPKASGA
jgi:hypothetical protein